MREDDEKRPRTAYGRSKLRAEEILLERAGRYGFHPVIPRFSPVYTTDLSTGFLKAFREQVQGGSILRKVAWPGRITMVRREDAVAVLIDLARSGLADGRAVNVTDGEVYSYRELLADLRRAYGEERTGFLPMPGIGWRCIRAVAWLPVLRKFVPWRLSCLIGDDLAADAARLRAVYAGPLTTWAESRSEISARGLPAGEPAR
jgi:nucleoside-diphosphate-sugar epimerase